MHGRWPEQLITLPAPGLDPDFFSRKYEMQQNPDLIAKELLQLLDRHLRSVWEGDVAYYQSTTAEDVSFFEWYISPQRIDGIEFHLRELRVHAAVLGGAKQAGIDVEHEILQPRVQVYGDTAILTYTLLLRSSGADGGPVAHKSHHETRVFHNFGSANAPEWRLVHCHKSPIATAGSMSVLR